MAPVLEVSPASGRFRVVFVLRGRLWPRCYIFAKPQTPAIGLQPTMVFDSYVEPRLALGTEWYRAETRGTESSRQRIKLPARLLADSDHQRHSPV